MEKQMNNDGTADLFLPNGEKMNVTLDAQGMLAARQATMSNLMFADVYKRQPKMLS